MQIAKNRKTGYLKPNVVCCCFYVVGIKKDFKILLTPILVSQTNNHYKR